MDFDGYKEWCARQSLQTDTSVAEALSVSAQTIRNWNEKRDIPLWVPYAIISIEQNLDPMPLTMRDLKNWQNSHRLKTYQDTATIFGRKRQAVHQWFQRGSLPKWLALACPGYTFDNLPVDKDDFNETPASSPKEENGNSND